MLIEVPDGWNVTQNAIEPPPGSAKWKLNGTTPSARCPIRYANGDAVYVPTGWIVDLVNHKIIAPLGFRGVPSGPQQGGYLESIPDNTPFTGIGQRMAHSITKIRVIS